MEYSIIVGGTPDNWKIATASDIIAMLNASSPLHLAHINSIRDLNRRNTRYCNESGDILAAAWHCAINNRHEIRSFEAKWVERMCGMTF